MTIQRAVVLISGRTREIPTTDTLDCGSGLDAYGSVTLGLGATNASAITLGRSGIVTTLPGDLVANGNVTLGSNSDDEMAVNAIITTDLIFGTKSTPRQIKPGATTGTAGIALEVEAGATTDGSSGGALYLLGGNSVGGTGGSVMIRAGDGSDDGGVYIGDATTASVTIGATGIPSYVSGSLTVAEAFTANGNVDLGNAAGDTISLVGSVDTSITFLTGTDRVIMPASNSGAAGSKLTLQGGGTSFASALGGSAVLCGGSSSTGSGGAAFVWGGDGASDGAVYIGSYHTSSVEIGLSGITTTVSGPLTVAELLSANGNVDLGSATSDTISFVGYVDSNIVFDSATTRYIYPAAKTGGAGAPMYFRGGGTTDANTGGIGYFMGGASTSGTGGSVILQGGAGATGGNTVLRGGDGTGTDGAVYVGDSVTSAVYLGAVAIPTTVSGALTVTGTFTANGTVQLGDANTDVLTCTGWLSPDANVVVLNANRSNTTTSFADVTGLSLAIPATGYYSFRAIVIFYTSATTTGIGLAMNGPTTSYLAYRTCIPTTGVQGTDAEMVEHVTAWDTGTATLSIDASSTRRVATIEGGFYASATGTLVVRFKSEVSTSAVYVTYGSRLDLWRA